MLQHTIKGKEVIIIHNKISDTYTVMYEGEIITTDERPVTDQDILKLNKEKEAALAKVIGNMFADLMRPLLS